MHRVIFAAALATACVGNSPQPPSHDPQVDRSAPRPVATTPAAAGGTWTPVATRAPISAALPILLTDGTVMVQGLESTSWYRLSPDPMGNYVNGTWTQLAPTPNNYSPLYYASGVLLDGRVV